MLYYDESSDKDKEYHIDKGDKEGTNDESGGLSISEDSSDSNGLFIDEDEESSNPKVDLSD